MYRKQCVYALEFHDHLIGYEEVEFVRFGETQSLIPNWHWPLALNRKSFLADFISEGDFVHRLEQARPQVPMNLDGSADDHLCDLCASVVHYSDGKVVRQAWADS